MVNNKITLNFEIEKGKFIDPYYFSARIKLTNESKNLLREKLSSTVQLDNLYQFPLYDKQMDNNGRKAIMK